MSITHDDPLTTQNIPADAKRFATSSRNPQSNLGNRHMSTPLALIGGWGVTAAIWTPLRAALGAGIVTCTPSLPGHAIDTVAPSATLDEWVDAVCAQLPETAIICGSSLGTVIAMRLALREPARVSKLVLIGATPCPVQRDDWRDALDATRMARLQNDFTADPAQLQLRFIARQVDGDALRVDIQKTLDNALVDITEVNRSCLADGLALLADTDLRGELAALACPVRLLHGANDAVVPVAAARWLAETLPEARLSTFDDAGHLPFVSRPAHCATLIHAFIDA